MDFKTGHWFLRNGKYYVPAQGKINGPMSAMYRRRNSGTRAALSRFRCIDNMGQSNYEVEKLAARQFDTPGNV
jgi:hypothetical protein